MTNTPSTPKDLTDPEADSCNSTAAEDSFNNTLKVLGDFWVLRIIGALAGSPQRFCELERTLKNSNPVTLTNRLKKLEEHEYVERTAESTDKQSVSYALTNKGQAVLPIVESIKAFSSTHTE